jgi:hypothetical protein
MVYLPIIRNVFPVRNYYKNITILNYFYSLSSSLFETLFENLHIVQSGLHLHA